MAKKQVFYNCDNPLIQTMILSIINEDIIISRGIDWFQY